MSRPRARKKDIERAKKWILAHPKATISETMIATMLSFGSVANLRKKLITEGLISKFAHTPTKVQRDDLERVVGLDDPPISTPSPLNPDVPNTNGDVFDRLPITPAERRQILEQLMRSGHPDHVIRANNELQKMDRALAADKADDFGPPAPTTLEDAIVQVTDIIEALMAWGGEDAVRKATTDGMARFYSDGPIDPPSAQGGISTEVEDETISA